MLIFISGGSGNGKSAFAEKVAASFGGKMIYIATMPVSSEEDLKKVERHHRLRKGRGFETLERPDFLKDLPTGGETVLLECMSTHVANVMFSDIGGGVLKDNGEMDADGIVTIILNELTPLFERQGTTVVVSADVSYDGEIYDPVTESYKTILMKVTREICSRADVVVEVVCGIPIYIKGREIELNEQQ